MKISLNWLSTHLDLTGLTLPEITQLLTFAGVEVEGVEQKGVASEKIVIAQIEAFEKHPDADKLSVCRVNGGLGEPLQIVCGAKNFKAGDKVPLAMEGATLPGDFTIKRTKMRGVESQGMMCSGKELGLSADSDGLLILPADAPVGTPLGHYLGNDTLLEIEVTPNRPDLLSHAGLARELAALTGRALKTPAVPAVPGVAAPASLVRIDAADRGPFYTARIVRGVKVGPSPDWLKQRLESIGLRPINNVVDITNFVLHDRGQPLHAFDLAKLHGGGVAVRLAAEGEAFLALDGKTYALKAEDLVIADADRAVAIAGVMGGEDSGVTETTTDVLLESAYFEPSGVRRTSRRLGLTSDSSYRFERGVDPANVTVASAAAINLIVQLAGGTADASVAEAGMAPVVTGTVALDPAHVRRLLGSDIDDDKIADILTNLGLSADGAGWRVPSFRRDLQRPVDLIEEVARVAGLEGVPSKTEGIFVEASAADASYDFAWNLRQRLVALGFYESRTIKLMAERQLADTLGYSKRMGQPLPLKNPLSSDHTHMRPSLLPGLLGVAAHNLRQGAEALRFFEMGTVFATSMNPKAGAAEAQALGILLSGPHVPSSWLKKAPFSADVFDLRGVLEALCPRTEVTLRPVDHPALLLAAEVLLAGKVVGLAGQLQPARVRELDARHPVYVAELNLGLIEQQTSAPVRFAELPRFPSISRDVALEVPETLSHGDLDQFFAKARKTQPLLENVALFDVFSDPSGEKIAAGKKSLAFTLTYRDKGRTLETKEVDAAHQQIVDGIKKAHPVSVR